MELIVHNFGPIKDAHIQTKRYNVLIGNTSTGKSVLAKLISIAYEYEFYVIEDGNFSAFNNLLKRYCIDFVFNKKTKIEIKLSSAHWIISDKSFTKIQNQATISTDGNASIYIPAERNLMSIFTNNIFSFLKTGFNIPESVKRFGSLYEAAKSENKTLSVDFMNIKVNFQNENNTITLGDDHTDIRFEQASSGMQSIIPLWAVFQYGINKTKHSTVIIEEPELNLFPTLQDELVNNLVYQLNQTDDKILITTHSPYILSVIDNLIYARDVYTKAQNNGNTDLLQRIERVVNPQLMIDYNDVAAYLCQDDGVVIRINDDEMRSTGAYALDKASNVNSNIFNELMSVDNEL